MAYSAEQWEKTRALFESGQYSLSEIQERTGISKSKISEKSKKEQWERGRNADYIEAKKTLAVKREREKGTVIQVLDDIADEQIRRERLVYGNAELIASKIPEMISGMIERQVIPETGEVVEVSLMTPSDLKTLAEANDKIAITLKVADRHAKSGDVNVNTQNNVAVQTITRRIIKNGD